MGLGVLNRSRLIGLAAIFCLLLAGRVIRTRLLVDPHGRWRENLWLDSLLAQSGPAPAAAEVPKPVLTTPLPINSCSEDSLTLLPGVGRVLAARIAAARVEGLVFRATEDLRRVKGIGPKLSARLDSLVIYATSATVDSISPPTR